MQTEGDRVKKKEEICNRPSLNRQTIDLSEGIDDVNPNKTIVTKKTLIYSIRHHTPLYLVTVLVLLYQCPLI
jgi:hypothetical protein